MSQLLADDLIQILTDKYGLPGEDLSPETRFDALEFDSLVMVELAVILEQPARHPRHRRRAAVRGVHRRGRRAPQHQGCDGLMEWDTTRAPLSGDSPEVLIVGAGPVGITLACELLQQGVRIRLIDRRARIDESDPHSKGILVWPRSLEVLRRIGVSERLAATGHRSKESATTPRAVFAAPRTCTGCPTRRTRSS